MTPFEIHYDRKLFGIRSRAKIKGKLPQQWNDLTPRQVQRICKLLYTPDNKHVIMLKCMRILLGVSWIQFFFFLPAMKQLWLGPDGKLTTFLRVYTHFLFENCTLTNNPFPKITSRKIQNFREVKLHGPNHNCAALQTDEFITAETHFSNYYNSKKEEDLDQLVATLYRPAGKGPKHDPKSSEYCGDIREIFNDKTVKNRLKLVKKIPIGKKLAVLSFYRSCRDIWEKTYDQVFIGKGAGHGYGWFEMIKAVNPDDWGTIPEKEKVPISNILLTMQVEILEAKKRKREAKNKK